MTAPTRDIIIDFLAGIFERRGGDEPVTMALHMLQGATHDGRALQPKERSMT